MARRKNGAGSGITLIANNCELSGDVHFSDELQVNGTIKGNIFGVEGSKAVIVISEKGRVKGDIRVPNVIVNGKVYGDIHSDKHIELAAKAEIVGDVYYHLIEMVMGSRVDGSLVHARSGKEPKTESKVQSSKRPTEVPAGERTVGSTSNVATVKSKSA